MKLLPKILLIIFVASLFAFTPWVNSVHAQELDCTKEDVLARMDEPTCDSINLLFSQNSNKGPWYNQNPTQFADKVFGGDENEIFGERYTFAQINWIINSIAAMLTPRVSNPEQLFQFINAINSLTSKIQKGEQPSIAEYGKLGPVGLFAGATTTLYSNPPASGLGEIKSVAQKIFDMGTGTNPAYAQGFGYTGLSTGGGVHALWTATRNMSYLIIVILLIAAGFLIMFRVKINPQTVVSLQNMIPKLIIAMLLITFSFAIAGFVIDLVYVAIAAFVGFMSISDVMLPGADVAATIRNLSDSSFWTYMWLQAAMWIFAFILSLAVAVVAITALSFIPVIGPIIGIVVAIIVFVWINITLVRIFIMLVRAYVMLILQICIGPLQIMLDLIPGQKGFGPWIRNIIAEASVFVVVPIMLFVQYVLSGWFFGGGGQGNGNALQIVDFRNLGGTELRLPYVELAGGALTNMNIITPMLIGIFIFSITPRIATMIKDALKIPPFKHGDALGQALAPYGKLEGYAEQYGAGRMDARIRDHIAAGSTPEPWETALHAGAIFRGRSKPQ